MFLKPSLNLSLSHTLVSIFFSLYLSSLSCSRTHTHTLFPSLSLSLSLLLISDAILWKKFSPKKSFPSLSLCQKKSYFLAPGLLLKTTLFCATPVTTPPFEWYDWGLSISGSLRLDAPPQIPSLSESIGWVFVCRAKFLLQRPLPTKKGIFDWAS